MLADQFILGAKEAGHEITEFDAAHAKISPCLACEACHRTGSCCVKDDMEKLKTEILQSDMVVFVTPLYFFNMSAQMKAAMDRLYAFLDQIPEKVQKMALIVAANNQNEHITDCVVMNYQLVCDYLKIENAGMILATGCGVLELTKNSKFPQEAFAFGKSL